MLSANLTMSWIKLTYIALVIPVKYITKFGTASDITDVIPVTSVQYPHAESRIGTSVEHD